MRGSRLELWFATTAVAIALTASGIPVRAAPMSEAEISAAVPMPEPANVAPPTAGDITSAGTTEPPTGATSPAHAAVPAVAPADISRAPEVEAPAAQVAPAPTAPATTTPAAAAPAAPEAQPIPAAAEAPAQTIDQKVADKVHDVLNTKGDRLFERKNKAAVESFYAARNYAPLWIENGAENARAKAAAAYLATVDAEGLDPADYVIPSFNSADPASLGEAELKLTGTILTYARQAQIGRVHFSRVSADIEFNLVAPEPAAVLAKVADAKNIGEALASFNPQQPGYKALKAKLAEARGRGGDAGPARVASGPVLKIGMEDARVPLLRERLGVAGADNSIYDKALADAVKKFQGRHDLAQTGTLNNATVDALNGPRRDHDVDIIIANMERWRWLPRDLGKAYVMVNIPDYTLKVVDDGATVWTTKIVAGKPGEKATPLLSETMKYITVNPTWNVPPSIINNEYLPALAQDPTVLDRMGLKLEHNRDGSVHIYQPPGDGNALGRIRFNFPNKFLVYQHDTPDKHLFALDKRAFSHGCMRVQYPDKYAEVLLHIANPKDGYTAERIRKMYGSSEHDIQLQTPIPVHLTYQTAFVDDAGRLVIRDDVYGRDSRLLAALKGDERRMADTPVERREASNAPPRRQAVQAARAPAPTTGFGFFGLFR